ncbi:MAG: metallophosphoesterase, partial [Rhodospirillales bacterium]
MQDRTRILHLTDLHLRQSLSGTAKRPERLSRDMPAVLDRLAGRIDTLGADVVVVSGDLLDIPDDYIDGANADTGWRAETAAASVADYRLFRDL